MSILGIFNNFINPITMNQKISNFLNVLRWAVGSVLILFGFFVFCAERKFEVFYLHFL